VTALAASLARNRITSASSRGVTHFAKSAFGMLARLAAVSMVEGSTALTVILPFHSAASASVSLALRTSLSVFQRLLAPFLPFVCEEVWSWWQTGSVHRSSWPEAQELLAAGAGEAREAVALEVTAEVLREVRKAKSQAQRPMRAPVRRVLVRDTAERLSALELGAGDLTLAGAIELIEPEQASEFAVEVELAPAE